jgi:PAS domain-containing protein
VTAGTDPGQPDDSVYCELSRLNNELVNSQRELAKTNAEVEQRIEERTKELSEMNRALQEHDALRQSQEELLKIFVKNVPAGVAMFDRDMRYLQVSDRWCADYSVDSSQVLGRSQYDIFPDMPEHWREVHRRGLEGETLRADVPMADQLVTSHTSGSGCAGRKYRRSCPARLSVDYRQGAHEIRLRITESRFIALNRNPTCSGLLWAEPNPIDAGRSSASLLVRKFRHSQ